MTFILVLLFLLSIFFVTPVFAEPVEVEIDWIIEGQPKITKSDPISNDIPDDTVDVLKSNDQNSTPVVDDFITGSGYMINDQEIKINSKEGQILNQILIEQKEINRDNFFHMIKYLDRYSDGYIELAEALLDPVNPQKYQINGRVYDGDINSNLEYFLFD